MIIARALFACLLEKSFGRRAVDSSDPGHPVLDCADSAGIVQHAAVRGSVDEERFAMTEFADDSRLCDDGQNVSDSAVPRPRAVM